MNYLAHGFRYLNDPLFLAGTAVPDWLSVADRRVRARARYVQPVVQTTACPETRSIGRGILQHHADDDAFHRCEQFMFLEADVTARFRAMMPDPFDHRPALMGHIVVELMLDAFLAAQEPLLLDEYYHAIGLVSETFVQAAVNQMASRQTSRLAHFITRFRQERFLYDYADDVRLLMRLNQVLRRVRLPPMERTVISVLSYAREQLQTHAAALLKATE